MARLHAFWSPHTFSPFPSRPLSLSLSSPLPSPPSLSLLDAAVLPRTSRDGGDRNNNNVDARSIYDRPGGPVEFQKFVFRGHKARFEGEWSAGGRELPALSRLTSRFLKRPAPAMCATRVGRASRRA